MATKKIASGKKRSAKKSAAPKSPPLKALSRKQPAKKTRTAVKKTYPLQKSPAVRPALAVAAAAPNPTGCCTWLDKATGQLQQESGVTRSECDARGGQFDPNRICG
jgi:hypothetical protein